MVTGTKSSPARARRHAVLALTRGYSTFHPWELIHFDWSEVPNAVTYRLEAQRSDLSAW
jgi:hypothetical protein